MQNAPKLERNTLGTTEITIQYIVRSEASLLLGNVYSSVCER